MGDFTQMSIDKLELAIESDERGIELAHGLLREVQSYTPTDGLRRVVEGMTLIIHGVETELDGLRKELASRRS